MVDIVSLFSLFDAAGALLTGIRRWSWEGPENRVKGYPNVVMSTDAQKLSEVKSITTTWAWSYDGADLVSNVAYDLFTSSAADGEREFEIMVWLDKRGGIGPLSLTEVRFPHILEIVFDMLTSGTRMRTRWRLLSHPR